MYSMLCPQEAALDASLSKYLNLEAITDASPGEPNDYVSTQNPSTDEH